MNMQEFLSTVSIYLRYSRADMNPNMEKSADMDHWRVTLENLSSGDPELMPLTYSKGSAHNGEPPTLEEVLMCLALDASGLDNTSSFEDWAQEYGYDPDSRTAYRTYKAVVKQTEALKRLMGEHYETLVYGVEAD